MLLILCFRIFSVLWLLLDNFLTWLIKVSKKIRLLVLLVGSLYHAFDLAFLNSFSIVVRFLIRAIPSPVMYP